MSTDYQEEVVTIQGAFPLEGTLTIPAKSDRKRPAVLIIPGTGKANRDGNLRRMKMNLYKDLAEVVAKLGFITLRYDKRGTHKSKGSYINAGFWDLVDDAESAVQYLKSRPEVDSEHIIILGHSEGCLIAPALNARQSQAGLILLAGTAEAGKDLIPRQSQQVFEEIAEMPGFKGKFVRFMIKIQKAEIRNQKIIQKALDSSKPSIKIFRVIPLNAKWLREQYAYDVTHDLPRVNRPTLVITGSKDIQVLPEHAKVIAEMVNGESEWHIVPDMNHILRKYEKSHTMLNLIKEYKKQLNQPMDPELIAILSAWLQKYNHPEFRK